LRLSLQRGGGSGGVVPVSALAPRFFTPTLHSNPFTTPELAVEATIVRPYIDLAYW